MKLSASIPEGPAYSLLFKDDDGHHQISMAILAKQSTALFTGQTNCTQEPTILQGFLTPYSEILKCSTKWFGYYRLTLCTQGIAQTDYDSFGLPFRTLLQTQNARKKERGPDHIPDQSYKFRIGYPTGIAQALSQYLGLDMQEALLSEECKHKTHDRLWQ